MDLIRTTLKTLQEAVSEGHGVLIDFEASLADLKDVIERGLPESDLPILAAQAFSFPSGEIGSPSDGSLLGFLRKARSGMPKVNQAGFEAVELILKQAKRSCSHSPGPYL